MKPMIILRRFCHQCRQTGPIPAAGMFPEIAFAGRSNVGKSSLINTLVNRKRLVKTSRPREEPSSSIFF